MAPRGSTKALSVEQEEHVAKKLGGVRSVSSGAAVSDAGDVRTPIELVECKLRGTYEKGAKSISIKLDDWAKICDEAWSELRTPLLALRIIDEDGKSHDFIVSDLDTHLHMSSAADAWFDHLRRGNGLF